MGQTARRRGGSWLIGMIGLPLVLTILTGSLFRLRLQNHWGYPATRFLSLWMAMRLRPHIVGAGSAWISAALLAQGVFIGASALSHAPQANGRRHARYYPAPTLADVVLQDWRNDTLCPLEVVAGPTFEAGIVPVHSGGQ